MAQNTVELWAMVHISACFWEKQIEVLSPKDERYQSDFSLWQVQKQTSVMVWGCISANSMGDLHVYEGTTDVEV